MPQTPRRAGRLNKRNSQSVTLSVLCASVVDAFRGHFYEDSENTEHHKEAFSAPGISSSSTTRRRDLAHTRLKTTSSGSRMKTVVSTTLLSSKHANKP